MSLTILIRTQLDSIPVLSDDCYTKQNYGANILGNSTLSVNTPPLPKFAAAPMLTVPALAVVPPV